jgi:hypothetical protein
VHELIAEAILARDADKAERYMRKHLEAIRETLRDKDRLDQPLIPRSFWNTPEASRLFIESESSGS